MIKILPSLLLLSLCFFACPGPPTEAESVERTQPPEETVSSSTEPAEDPAVLLDNDLNGDGEPDFLKVVLTKRTDRGLGLERDLEVYHLVGEDTVVWYAARGVILPTEHGGMMGDPFVGVKIASRTIVFDHHGGSRWKWDYTHRFRFQEGDFRLIGATVQSGAVCEYWVKLDYNLSTGMAHLAKETEDCENDDLRVVRDTIRRRLLELPVMDGFYPGDNEFVVNDTLSVYF